MVTLTYGTFSLELRNPDFGDKEGVEIRRINRRTRCGDLVIMRDPAWPKYATYIWKWSFLTQYDVSRLLEFVRASLGQTITVIDYEGRTLTNAIIMTPADEVSQDGMEDFRAGISFQVPL